MCVCSSLLSVYLVKGGKEYNLRAHFGLPSVESGECLTYACVYVCVCVCMYVCVCVHVHVHAV